jgi:hypothetical protein
MRIGGLVTMNKSFNGFCMALIVVIFISCATTIKFGIEHPPLVDMRNMETLTVIPLEWKDNGEYDYLANDLTKTLISGVKRIKTYKFVEPSDLKNIRKSSYWEYVDVFIEGEIIDVVTHNETEIREEKDGDKTKTKEYATKTVTVTIDYKYFRAIDDKILGSFTKTAQSKTTFDNSSRSSKWWAELLLNIFIPKGKSTTELAKSAIRQFSSDMRNELSPYKITEKRRIRESISKDPSFKEANRHIGRKNYFEALTIYKNIYEQTGSIVAGYNMALLLEANNQFLDALDLLEKLDDNISKSGINSPPFIEDEMEKVKLIIDDLEILEEYDN